MVAITRSYAACALLAAMLSVVLGRRIDSHIHSLPPPYIAALNAAGGDPSGYPTPNWSPEDTIASMDMIGTSIGILSISTPGVPIAGTGQEARALARTLNQYLGDLSNDSEYGSRLGFFGVLPDWQDVNGTLAEIDYLFREQKLCSGVTVYTSYGGKLLGDLAFTPIWGKLQYYKALVFIHPGLLDVYPKFIATSLPQPIIDYPLATTRTAVDLVISGTVSSCPDVDFILAHAGGTIPYLGQRAIGSLLLPTIAENLPVNALQAVADFGRFYYDTALSTSTAQLDGLLDFTDASHIVFGSDFPYAPEFIIDDIVAEYESYVVTSPHGASISTDVLGDNSVGLLNKHSQGRVFM